MRSALVLASLGVVGAVVLCTPVAFAQIATGGESLSLSLSPASPRPGSVALVTPESTVLDFANSTMSVSVNGASIYAGNVKTVPVTLKGVGETTTITVSITSGGSLYSKTLSLKPGDVSLTIEPLGSAPALYPAKPFVPESGKVRVVAVADLRTSAGARLDPDTLAYSWVVDGTTLMSASGVGKSALTLSSPLAYRSMSVGVTVQNRAGTVVGADTISVSPQSPTTRLYVADPLQGILFDHALGGSYTIAGAETALIAVPYSLPTTAGAPTVQWFLNGATAETGPTITLRPQGSGRGSASLSVTASPAAGSQTTSAELSLIFGASGSNIFGL